MSKQQPQSTLKSALKLKIESAKLSSEQLCELNRLQQRFSNTENDSTTKTEDQFIAPATTATKYKFAWAAVFVLAIINLVWLFPAYLSDSGTQTFVSNSEKINLVTAEVVRNHLNRKPLEIEGDEEQQVFNYFTELNFRPVKSQYLATLALAPVGGRYCSLQTKRAAFLSYQSEKDDLFHTVYQVPYETDVFPKLPNFALGEKPVTTWSNGIKITLWTEKGLVFAMTD